MRERSRQLFKKENFFGFVSYKQALTRKELKEVVNLYKKMKSNWVGNIYGVEKEDSDFQPLTYELCNGYSSEQYFSDYIQYAQEIINNRKSN